MAQRNMSGALWRNEKKGVDDNKPNYTGTITIGNVQYKVAAWDCDGGGTKPIVNLVIQLPEPTTPACYAATDLSNIIVDPFNDPNNPPPF